MKVYIAYTLYPFDGWNVDEARICGIALTKEQAEMICSHYFSNEQIDDVWIREYDTDDYSDYYKDMKLYLVMFDKREGKITRVRERDSVEIHDMREYTVHNGVEYYRLSVWAINEAEAEKIAREKIEAYRKEHGE